MLNENISIMDLKQNSLLSILKQASEYFLTANYEKSIPLYEHALKLVNEDCGTDDYDLYENDVCAIEYALCMCYIMDQKYFEKANEEFAPLVISYGKQFPTLYYAQAKLFLQQRLFEKTEKCINDGLEALLNISEKGVFRTNWPGTEIQIPESDTNVLRKALKNLKKQCSKQSLGESNIVKGSVSNSSTNSKTLPDSNKNIKLSKKKNKESSTSNSSQENLSTKELESISQTKKLNIFKETCPENEVSLDGTTKIKSVLKVDVPEFIPKSFLVDSYKENVLGGCYVNNYVDVGCATDAVIAVELIEKFCQTTVNKPVHKCTQVGVKTSNAAVQTLKREKESCQKCSSMEKETSSNVKTLENENKGLQKKLKHLKDELNASNKRVLQEQQNRQTLEQTHSINNVKLEVQLDVISDKCKLFETKFEEELNKNKVLSSMFMVQFMRNSNMQKLVLNKHVKRCEMMITNLKNVAILLTHKSIPTLADCQKHIHLWQVELERTMHCLRSFQLYQDKLLIEFNNGNFLALPEPPEFSYNFDEPRNILQENFQTAISSLIHEIRDLRISAKKYHDEYYYWWNSHGKFVYQSGQSPAVGPPQQAPYQPQAAFHGQPLVLQENIVPNHQMPKQPEIHNNSNIWENKTDTNSNWPEMFNAFKTNNCSNIDRDTSIIKPIDDAEKSKVDVEAQRTKDPLEKSIPSKPEPLESDILEEAGAQEIKTDKNCINENKQEHKYMSPMKLKQTKLIANNSVLSQLDDDFKMPETLAEICEKTVNLAISENPTSLPEKALKTSEKIPDKVETVTIPSSTSKENQASLLQDNIVECSLPPDGSLSPQKDQKSNQPDIVNGLSRNKSLTDVCAASKPVSSSANNDLINLNQLLKKEDQAAQLGSSLKALGGPKFYSLYCYVKSKIPNINEGTVWNALTAVKQKRVKLSGMSRDSIVAAVQVELITSMELGSDDAAAKVAWGKVNNEPVKWNKDQQDTSCVICIESFDRMPVTSLKCDHKFHTECIRKWFSTNCICPVCRIHATADEDFPPLGS